MSSVILKGRKNGYEILMDSAAKFDDNMVDLNNLLQKLSDSEVATEQDPVVFYLNSGRRLLNHAQVKRVEAVFDHISQFKLKHLSADVVDWSVVKQEAKSQSIHIEMSVIRSGQEIDYDSDVLFLGTLHQGGILRTHGNIFVMGESEGVLSAGFPDNNDAVIVGDLSQTTQVRIADAIQILNHKKQSFNSQTVCLINDLHVLDFDTLDHLDSLRPNLRQRMEDSL